TGVAAVPAKVVATVPDDGSDRVAVPAQLPGAVMGFTGRAAELRRLDGLVAADSGAMVGVISGSPGVGKTALAVQWAHRVATRFADGQLYVNLRGFDPHEPPLDPSEALRGFLDACAVAAHRIPADRAGRAALYRSVLAGRCMIIVLDNAHDADQVRPLLPGSPGCLAVVTSRNRLAGLVAAEGAYPIQLDLLAATEARDLLSRRLGARRVQTQAAAVDAFVDRCAGLPLALAIVAARAATRPELPLGTLADELGAACTALDALDAGDGETTDARAVFSWSYRTLSTGAARLFRLLGVASGPDIGSAAAASLAGSGPAGVRSLLAELTRANLLQEHIPGRFSCHDLLRAYAAELAGSPDREAERRDGLRRVIDHYLQSAHAAVMRFEPHRRSVLDTPAVEGVVAEDFTDRRQAMMAWFIAEHRVLVATVTAAAAAGLDEQAWKLAWTLPNFLGRLGHFDDMVAVQRIAVEATERLGHRPGQAESHHHLGRAYHLLGRFDEAYTHLERARHLFTDLDDEAGLGATHSMLGVLLGAHNRYHDAIGHASDALAVYRRIGDQAGVGRATNALGCYYAGLGDFEQSLAHCQQAAAMDERLGGRYALAAAWDSVGYAYHHLGYHEQAIDSFHRSLELLRDAGGGIEEADVLVHLGDAQRAVGNPDTARDAWSRALRILKRIGRDQADVHARLHSIGGDHSAAVSPA
ncbi:MAG: tetratricopeptide repeat protein, partial [Catenulispora sp.]